MVKNLLIMRHCEASFNSATNRDFDRLLSKNGESQAIILGQHINGLGVNVDAFYVSPAKRTMQTLKGVEQELANKPRIMDSEELYEATDNVLKAAINRFDDIFDTIILLGHNPSVAMLFSYLSGEIRDYSPGCCAWLEFKVDSWAELSGGMAELKDFYHPGQLQ